MKIAVHVRQIEPFSFANYRANLISQLQRKGCIFVPFSSVSEIGRVDLVWEPGIGGSGIPRFDILKIGIPVVMTCHGAAPFVLSPKENWHTVKGFIKERLIMWADRAAWFHLKRKVAGIIAVSAYGAQEITSVFNLPKEKVRYIYHGVDHDLFREDGPHENNEGRPYLLCVAQSQPKKNIDRLLRAYALLPFESRPELVLVVPGYPKVINTAGVHVIYDKKTAIELAAWYRGAMGFVFPSLHETFGFPIVEAMACGCPVITSNGTACKEIAGDAAILVNPRDEGEIASAMFQLANDPQLRDELRRKGLERAKQFTWQRSAEEHFNEFQKALKVG